MSNKLKKLLRKERKKEKSERRKSNAERYNDRHIKRREVGEERG